MLCDFTFWLKPRQLGDETAVWCMYGGQVSVNLRAACRSRGITNIYVLYEPRTTAHPRTPNPTPYLILQKSLYCTAFVVMSILVI